MSAIVSTTIVAVAFIAAATVGLCTSHLDGTQWLAAVGTGAGSTLLLHIAAAGAKNGSQ